jgi:DNA-binding transcriptional LysR family regulator
MGEELRLRVVIGDLCPLPRVLGMLSSFFARCPATRLDLHFEAVTGPWERLFDDDTDLILHRLDKSDPRLEWIDLGTLSMVPVVAPGFLEFPITCEMSPDALRDYTQRIIRDTALHSKKQDHFVLPGAHQCTGADHQMKKQLILSGMAWGHF